VCKSAFARPGTRVAQFSKAPLARDRSNHGNRFILGSPWLSATLPVVEGGWGGGGGCGMEGGLARSRLILRG
jgi:hypothetical protein